MLKILRKVFKKDKILLGELLGKEGISVFHWDALFIFFGNWSNKRQKQIAKLISEHIHGNTVTILNENVYLLTAKNAFLNMGDKTNQREFERFMEENLIAGWPEFSRNLFRGGV